MHAGRPRWTIQHTSSRSCMSGCVAYATHIRIHILPFKFGIFSALHWPAPLVYQSDCSSSSSWCLAIICLWAWKFSDVTRYELEGIRLPCNQYPSQLCVCTIYGGVCVLMEYGVCEKSVLNFRANVTFAHVHIVHNYSFEDNQVDSGCVSSVTWDVLLVGRAEPDCLEGGTHEETLRPQVNLKVECRKFRGTVVLSRLLKDPRIR